MLYSLLAFGWLPSDPKDWIFEIVGIVASLIVFASFFWSNEKITRIVNMAGCVIFVIYAILIQSLSVCIINGACFILHVVKLVQMHNKAKRSNSQKQNDLPDNEEQPAEEKQNEQFKQE